MNWKEEAKELSECLDLMPKNIKELQKMAYNVILDAQQQLLNKLEEKLQELIEDYKDIGLMLQGDSKTINTEKLHAFYLVKYLIQKEKL